MQSAWSGFPKLKLYQTFQFWLSFGFKNKHRMTCCEEEKALRSSRFWIPIPHPSSPFPTQSTMTNSVFEHETPLLPSSALRLAGKSKEEMYKLHKKRLTTLTHTQKQSILLTRTYPNLTFVSFSCSSWILTCCSAFTYKEERGVEILGSVMLHWITSIQWLQSPRTLTWRFLKQVLLTKASSSWVLLNYSSN